MLYKTVWNYFRDGKRVLFPHNHRPCDMCFNEAGSVYGTKYGMINPDHLIEIHDARGQELLTVIHEFLHLAAMAYAVATGGRRYDPVFGEYSSHYEPGFYCRKVREDKIDSVAEDIMHNNPHLIRYIVRRVPELSQPIVSPVYIRDREK